LESSLAAGQKRFFELCVNTGLFDIVLGEIDVTDVKTDGELFERIHQKYKRIRGHRIKRSFVRPTDIHFVQVSHILFTTPNENKLGDGLRFEVQCRRRASCGHFSEA